MVSARRLLADALKKSLGAGNSGSDAGRIFDDVDAVVIAFLTACRTGEAPVAVSSLVVTTLVTLLAVKDLARARGETLEAPAPDMSDAGA